MATKGRTTQGASSASIETRPAGRQESFTAGDVINSVTAWLDVTTGAHNINAKLMASDGTFLANATSQSVGAGSDLQVTFTIPGGYTVGATTDIVLTVISDNPAGAATVRYTAASITAFYDSGADSGMSYSGTQNWASIGADAIGHDFSIAADYTPSRVNLLTGKFGQPFTGKL